MAAPPLEVADLVRAAGPAFIEHSRRWLTRLHLKVLTAIERCRTAALGGHVDECTRCGHRAISYNSCRSRHCPKCQANVRDRWLEARKRELLPVETLLTIARDPKHLGAEIGFFSVLHTWNQKLEHHPHVHCVVPAGGLAPDHTRWIHPRYSFFLPVGALSRVFRGKFVAGLRKALAAGKLGFHGTLKPLARPKVFSSFLRQFFGKDWVVYSKRPFGGPEHALRYLGRYTHRVGISNHRLVSFAGDKVTFRWRDSAHKNKKRLMTLHVEEFLRRFLLHVLPKGFVRIRHFGFLSTRNRARLLPLCFQLLGAAAEPPAQTTTPGQVDHQHETVWLCPECGGPMRIVERLSAAQLRLRSPPEPLPYAA
jgi:hypothetical protein